MDGQTLFRPLLLVTVVAGCAAPQWTAHQDPRGFSLELPRGWKASSAGAAGTRPWGWKTTSDPASGRTLKVESGSTSAGPSPAPTPTRPELDFRELVRLP